MISYFYILQTFLVLETSTSSNQHQLTSLRKIKVQLVQRYNAGSATPHKTRKKQHLFQGQYLFLRLPSTIT